MKKIVYTFILCIVVCLNTTIVGSAVADENIEKDYRHEVLSLGSDIDPNGEYKVSITYIGLDQKAFHEDPLTGQIELEAFLITLKGSEINVDAYYKDFEGFEFVCTAFEKFMGGEYVLVYFYAKDNEYIEEARELAFINKEVMEEIDMSVPFDPNKVENKVDEIEETTEGYKTAEEWHEIDKALDEQANNPEVLKQEAREEIDAMIEEGMLEEEEREEYIASVEAEIDENFKTAEEYREADETSVKPTWPLVLLICVPVLLGAVFWYAKNKKKL